MLPQKTQRSKKRRIPQQPQHNASNPVRSNQISCGFSLQKLLKTIAYKKEERRQSPCLWIQQVDE